jgi:hypothetical protein
MRGTVTRFIVVYGVVYRRIAGCYILNKSYAGFSLGDVIDDFCVKCRRVTNHSIVSLMNGDAAKVRCRTCYSDHDYRHEQAPPSKKELLKQKELYAAVLAGVAPVPEVEAAVEAVEETPVVEPVPEKKSKKKKA